MDKVVKFKPKREKKIYIVLALLLVATLVLIYINLVNSAYKKVVNFNKSSIMGLGEAGCSFGKADGNIIVCDQEGLTAINKNGEIAWKYSYAMNNPIVSTAGEYALYADLDGNSCHVVSRGNLVSSYESPYEIITAKINENGYYAIAAKERGYKSQVLVFDRNGNQVYAWHSTKYYVLDASVTNGNNAVFVAALNTESEDKAISNVLYFSFNSKEPKTLETGENNLVTVVCNVQGNTVAIGDFGAYEFDKSGKKVFSVDYEGRTLQEYAVSGGTIVLGLTKNSIEGYYGGSVVEVYNIHGSLRGKYEIDDEIEFLDADGGKILVNSPDGACILTDTGRVYGDLTFENNVREGLIFDAGKKLLLVNGSNINVYDAK